MQMTLDGLRVNYTVSGSGKYVFLLHGWGANLELYKNIAEVISSQYTVVSLDFPGFGGSEEPHEPWSVSDFTKFTISFISQFDCDEVILLGHSYGGRVIIKMASQDDLPFKISKIVLVDSAGILPKKTFKQKARQRFYKIGRKFLETKLMKKLFPNALDAFRKKMGSADYNAASPIMRQSLVLAVNEDLTSLLPKISAPTLLIWGDKDTATPLSDGQLMEKSIPDAGLVVLEGSGHFSFLEQPYVFQQVIKSFLKIS